jgi:hypothetical protein
MKKSALLALSLVAVSIVPAAAQNNTVLFRATPVTSACAGYLQNWGCTPPLLGGWTSTYSCRSTEVTWNGINSWWTRSVNVPPGYLCFFQYCGPGGTHLQCHSIARHGGKAITLEATPTAHQ